MGCNPKIASVIPQVNPEDAPVHGEEKLETNCFKTSLRPRANVESKSNLIRRTYLF